MSKEESIKNLLISARLKIEAVLLISTDEINKKLLSSMIDDIDKLLAEIGDN
jgi:hypothetical protein